MEKLGLNAGFLVAQFVNFFVVFLILRAAWPRVLGMLDNRAARIAKSLEDARVAEQARANAERDAQKLIEERKAEGAKLVEEARTRAEAQAKTILDDAAREVAGLKEKALKEGADAKSAALGDVRSDVITLAMAAAERLIGKSMQDENLAREVISDFFSTSAANLHGLGDHVEVTSALPLTANEMEKVRQATGASKIDTKVDPSILGGLVVRAGDRVVDGSIRAGVTDLSGRLK